MEPTNARERKAIQGVKRKYKELFGKIEFLPIGFKNYAEKQTMPLSGLSLSADRQAVKPDNDKFNSQPRIENLQVYFAQGRS